MDKAVLTGESIPVEKEIGSESFSGTLLVRGKGYLEITRTGTASAMGRLAAMIGNIEAEKTPLEKRLEAFGNQVARAILALSVLLVIGGLWVEGWRAPLLDRPSLRFVVLAGAAQALIGGVLLLQLPRYGYDDAMVRSALFLYACSAQLLFAYPARRVSVAPLSDTALHLAVLLGAGLQALVLLVPSLRAVLGLALPDSMVVLWLVTTVFFGWLAAELTSRLVRYAEAR